MSDLNNKYQNFITLLEKNIKNEEQLNIMKRELTEIMVNFVDNIDRIMTLEKKQSEIEKNIKNLQVQVDNIEQDFYISDEYDDEYIGDQMHDNDYEFEITCPYCKESFVADNSFKFIKQIKCPNCKKTVELNWDSEKSCHDNCTNCQEHCYKSEDNGQEEMENIEMSIAEENEEYNSTDLNKDKSDTKQNTKKNKASNLEESDVKKLDEKKINSEKLKTNNKNNTQKNNKNSSNSENNVENEDDM